MHCSKWKILFFIYGSSGCLLSTRPIYRRNWCELQGVEFRGFDATEYQRLYHINYVNQSGCRENKTKKLTWWWKVNVNGKNNDLTYIIIKYRVSIVSWVYNKREKYRHWIRDCWTENGIWIFEIGIKRNKKTHMISAHNCFIHPMNVLIVRGCNWIKIEKEHVYSHVRIIYNLPKFCLLCYTHRTVVLYHWMGSCF